MRENSQIRIKYVANTEAEITINAVKNPGHA